MITIPNLTYLTATQTLFVMCDWEVNHIYAVKQYMFYASIQPGTMDSMIITKLSNFYNAYFK